jgi:hypothetical protein
MQKELRAGQIVVIEGGKYHGHGAQVRKVHENGKTADFMISGKIRKLSVERVKRER